MSDKCFEKGKFVPPPDRVEKAFSTELCAEDVNNEEDIELWLFQAPSHLDFSKLDDRDLTLDGRSTFDCGDGQLFSSTAVECHPHTAKQCVLLLPSIDGELQQVEKSLKGHVLFGQTMRVPKIEPTSNSTINDPPKDNSDLLKIDRCRTPNFPLKVVGKKEAMSDRDSSSSAEEIKIKQEKKSPVKKEPCNYDLWRGCSVTVKKEPICSGLDPGTKNGGVEREHTYLKKKKGVSCDIILKAEVKKEPISSSDSDPGTPTVQLSHFKEKMEESPIKKEPSNVDLRRGCSFTVKKEPISSGRHPGTEKGGVEEDIWCESGAKKEAIGSDEIRSLQSKNLGLKGIKRPSPLSHKQRKASFSVVRFGNTSVSDNLQFRDFKQDCLKVSEESVSSEGEITPKVLPSKGKMQKVEACDNKDREIFRIKEERESTKSKRKRSRHSGASGMSVAIASIKANDQLSSDQISYPDQVENEPLPFKSGTKRKASIGPGDAFFTSSPQKATVESAKGMRSAEKGKRQSSATIEKITGSCFSKIKKERL